MKGILPISINTIFWCFVSGLRYLSDHSQKNNSLRTLSNTELLAATKDVAVCLPAHNEELVLKDAINSLLQLVPARQIYVVSDGSHDQTAHIARQMGCIVLEQNPGLGKAKALQKIIAYFRLLDRYRYLLIADADTIFDQNFLRNALPLFDPAKRVAVVAAYTKTRWQNHPGFSLRMFFVAYRMRLYGFIQPVIMYGQTWHRTNVNPVIPGFACLYRTDILRHLSFYAPGVIIEDFNMSFQLHKQKLGTIAHHPSVIATTQDPDNFADYRSQILRWNLGFFQTIKYWGVWPSFFWLSLGASLIETFIFTLLLFVIPALLLLVLCYSFVPSLFPTNNSSLTWLSSHWIELLTIYALLALVDYLVTIFVGFKEREDKLSIYGLAFIFLRYVDAAIFLYAFKEAFATESSGIWVPPERRSEPSPQI
jgi:cellulose synthase/poly-beta-1,6-N-acetylglucosamine synthase-like glycosyltransferase